MEITSSKLFYILINKVLKWSVIGSRMFIEYKDSNKAILRWQISEAENKTNYYVQYVFTE